MKEKKFNQIIRFQYKSENSHVTNSKRYIYVAAYQFCTRFFGFEQIMSRQREPPRRRFFRVRPRKRHYFKISAVVNRLFEVVRPASIAADDRFADV